MFRLPKFSRSAPPPAAPAPADDPHATPSYVWTPEEMLELYRHAEQELVEGRMDAELWRLAMGESSDPRKRTQWYLGARTTRLREIAEAQLRKEGSPPARCRARAR